MVHRKYIHPEQVCTDAACQQEEVVQKVFQKGGGPAPSPVLSSSAHYADQPDRKRHFITSFETAIASFVEAEDRKHPASSISRMPAPQPEYLQGILDMHPEAYPLYTASEKLVFGLTEAGDMAALLQLQGSGQLDLQQALTCTYGGQAVGNGYQFLLHYHILPLYLLTNSHPVQSERISLAFAAALGQPLQPDQPHAA